MDQTTVRCSPQTVEYNYQQRLQDLLQFMQYLTLLAAMPLAKLGTSGDSLSPVGMERLSSDENRVVYSEAYIVIICTCPE